MEFGFPMSQLPWWLSLAALVIAGLGGSLLALERRRRARLGRFVSPSLAPRLVPGYSERLRRPLVWFSLLGFGALAATFAQPHWGQAWQKVHKHSRDVIICLDTSESMLAANPLPNRLDRAKQKITALVDRCPGDRFGLVVFSGAAGLICPLTLDRGYFKTVLDSVDTNIISAEGTNIAEALRETVEALQAQEVADGYVNRDTRVILLISDGEQVAGDAKAEAEKAAAVARVYVMGVGDPNGAEIMMPDHLGRYVPVMDAGKPHLSKLDEDTLKAIALAGDGVYVRSTVDHWDIDQIWEAMKRLEARVVASDLRLRLVNRFQWPLALAIASFAAEGFWLAALPRMRHWRLRRERRAGGELGHA